MTILRGPGQGGPALHGVKAKTLVHIDRQIGIWGSWIAGLAFSVAMMAAPEYFHLSPGNAAVVIWGGFIAFIVTIIPVVAKVSAREQERQNKVIWPVLMMATGAVIFLLGAAWYFWPSEQKMVAYEDQTNADSPTAAPVRLLRNAIWFPHQ